MFFMRVTCLNAQEIPFPADETSIYTIPEHWSPVPEVERMKTLQMLVETSKNTLQKINVLQCQMVVEYQQKMSPDDVKAIGVLTKDNQSIYQTHNFTAEFIGDIKRKIIFRSKKITQQYFEAEGKRLILLISFYMIHDQLYLHKIICTRKKQKELCKLFLNYQTSRK